ncbi:iron-sulfur cluster assembly accessory protein [Cypionkella sp.]|jgi:iron-sulfur cluster assembly protein|uniref:HesB/IscA family protein n=1 Tax=Cypionkella sp. TaxID=2811411 RepID=UPI002767C478|nr:iron-sulfur cluster assembly accessory protein [Cypionkella sp.]
MFGIPGKAAVTLTPIAAKQIAQLMSKQGVQGLRIGVKKGGCAGMEYTMDYVAEVNPLDEVVEQDGARVMIAPMAQMFLFGTQIDYEVDLLQAGFKFNNPNVAEACGCGESIKFKDA